jgi:hypothetical protein
MNRRESELAALKADQETSSLVNMRFQVSQWERSAIIGGHSEAVLLGFVFGAIASGFFAEIGKGPWLSSGTRIRPNAQRGA